MSDLQDPANITGNFLHIRLGFSGLVVCGMFVVICPVVCALFALVRMMMIAVILSDRAARTSISALVILPLLEKLEDCLDDAVSLVFDLLNESLDALLQRGSYFDNITENGDQGTDLLELPKVKYGGLASDGTNECAICCSSLGEDDDVRLLPSCEHYFHLSCIDRWLLRRQNCPLCRRRVHHSAL